MEIITFLVIGAIAGLLAAQMMRGGGYGLWMNMALGVAGSLVGGLLFGLLGISAGGILGAIITATAGAALLLFVAGKLKR